MTAEACQRCLTPVGSDDAAMFTPDGLLLCGPCSDWWLAETAEGAARVESLAVTAGDGDLDVVELR